MSREIIYWKQLHLIPTINKRDVIFAYRKNLINQEAKFQSQLNELTKQLSIRDAEANKLKFQMEELQRDVFAKAVGMDSEYNSNIISLI